jgi:hypothetical protein
LAQKAIPLRTVDIFHHRIEFEQSRIVLFFDVAIAFPSLLPKGSADRSDVVHTWRATRSSSEQSQPHGSRALARSGEGKPGEPRAAPK